MFWPTLGAPSEPSVVDVRVHHELDVVGGGAVEVQAQAVDPEVIGGVGVVRPVMQEAGLQPAAHRDRGQRLRFLDCRRLDVLDCRRRGCHRFAGFPARGLTGGCRRCASLHSRRFRRFAGFYFHNLHFPGVYVVLGVEGAGAGPSGQCRQQRHRQSETPLVRGMVAAMSVTGHDVSPSPLRMPIPDFRARAVSRRGDCHERGITARKMPLLEAECARRARGGFAQQGQQQNWRSARREVTVDGPCRTDAFVRPGHRSLLFRGSSVSSGLRPAVRTEGPSGGRFVVGIGDGRRNR